MIETLELLGRLFGRCAVIGILLVSIWFALYQSGWLCELHGTLFGINEHECSLLSYGGMGILKLFIYTFFILPWLAIKLELIRRKNA